MQTQLFGVEIEKEKEVVCCESESGFDVVNYSEFSESEIGIKARINHFPNKKTNEKIGVTKEEFEKQVKECYKTNKIKWINELLVSINYRNGMEIMKSFRKEAEEEKKKDREQMIKEVGADGFQVFSGHYEYWTHYGKKSSKEKEIEAVLDYNNGTYGLIHTSDENHTWIITKNFGLYLINKYSMKKVEGTIPKWLNPIFEPYKTITPDKIIEPKPFMEEKKAIIDIERRSDDTYAIFPKIEKEFCMASYVGKKGDNQEAKEIEELKKALINKGIKSENISVKEHTYTYEADKPEVIEKNIKEYSEKLKEALKKKYGFEVTIKVEKKV